MAVPSTLYAGNCFMELEYPEKSIFGDIYNTYFCQLFFSFFLLFHSISFGSCMNK